jgi:HD-GYP domain-containing protein (c-di-GMP phosphodiesterase class II)
MARETEYKKSAVEIIKQNIKILNITVLLIVFSLLFLVVKSLYAILGYVPIPSVVTILLSVVVLVVIDLQLTNIISKKAIKKILENTSKLNTMLATTRDIREIVYGDVLLDKIIESSLKITGADAGSILLTEDDRLVFKTAKGIKTEKILGLSIQKSCGIAGWAVNNSSSVRVDNVKKDSRFDPSMDNITGYETKSVLCAPLRLNTGIIGALELLNKKDGAFSEEDEELISYFADQAAISIARARFYEDQKNFEIHLTDILICAIEGLTPGKHGHSIRVAKYSNIIANGINMSENEKRRLHRASLFHDIGFLKIKGILSQEEYKTHCRIAYEMLSPINFYADIAPIILHHHERYDGNGYPAGLAGEAIPLESRIIAIAEAFDVMVSSDSYKYKEGMTSVEQISLTNRFNRAIEELTNNAGTQFDPKLVEAFVTSIDESSLEGM